MKWPGVKVANEVSNDPINYNGGTRICASREIPEKMILERSMEFKYMQVSYSFKTTSIPPSQLYKCGAIVYFSLAVEFFLSNSTFYDTF